MDSSEWSAKAATILAFGSTFSDRKLVTFSGLGIISLLFAR